LGAAKKSKYMTGDMLIIELAHIVETTAYPRFNRDSGVQEPITPEQWDILSDKFLALCAKNKPRESKPVLDSRAGGDER
jgi:hypothetical protein